MKNVLTLLILVSFSAAAQENYYVAEQEHPYVYDRVASFSEGLAAVMANNKISFVNTSGKIAFTADIDVTLNDWNDPKFRGGLVVLRSKGMRGVLNKQGKVVLPFIYSFTGLLQDGMIYVEDSIKGVGYCNKEGKLIVPLQYEKTYVGNFSEGLAAVKKKGKFGFINTRGQLVIPHLYKTATPFHNGYSLVTVDSAKNRKAFINKTGKILTTKEYDGFEIFNGNHALVWVNNPGSTDFEHSFFYGLIDNSGKEIISPDNKFERIEVYAREGLFLVVRNDSSSVINTAGKTIVPLTKKSITISEGVIIIYDAVQSELDLYSTDGKKIMLGTGYQPNETFYYFNEGLMPVKNRYFQTIVINKAGKIIVPERYDNISAFKNGYATVYIKNKGWGLIDSTGKEVLTPQLSIVRGNDFAEGWLPVSQNYRYWTFVNKEGKFINGSQANALNSISAPRNEYVYSGAVGKYWLVNKGGYLSHKRDSIAGGKWGLLDADNKIVIPALYDLLSVDTISSMLFAYQNWDVSIVSGKGTIARAAKNSKIGILGFDGKIKYPFQLHALRTQNDKGKHIIVQGIDHYKCGVMNSSCKLIVPMHYDLIYDFADSVIAAKKNGKFGAINLKNEILVPFEYDQVLSGQPNSRVSYEFRSQTSYVQIDFKGKKIGTAPEPYESKFQTAFSKATNSKQRGEALGRFLSSVYNAKDTAGFARLVNQKFRQVEKVDFFSIYEAYIQAPLDMDATKLMTLFRSQLSQKQWDVMRKYSLWTTENFNRKYSQGLPELVNPPADTPQPGQPWRE